MSRRRERAAYARHRRANARATRAEGATLPPPIATSTATGYLPGLDGLRALAIIAVVVYHAHVAWLPGGFLGVDVFFVVSGFIITRGLLAEWDARARIDAPAFWVRRARRLLPALAVLLAAGLAYCALAERDRVSQLRVDSLASLFYVTNWYLVADHQSYFAAFGPPSLLRHLWSLAVEEQFYVAWPFVLTVGLMLFGRKRIAAVIAALAVLSAVEMALLYQSGASTSRLYYGTDTHLSGLLAGAALAVPFTAGSRLLTAAGGRRYDLAALLGLALIAYLTFSLDDQGALLYNGGFAAVAVASGVLVVAAVHPATLLSRTLERAPFRWIGRRSYGIYLWHWPIFVLLMPADPTSPSGLAMLAGEALAAVAVAALSYRFIEEPVRHGGLRRLAARVRGWSRRRRFAAGSALAGAGVTAALALAWIAQIPGPETPPYFATSHVRLVRDTAGSDLAVPAETATSVPVLVQHSASLAPPPAFDPLALEVFGANPSPTPTATYASAPLRGGGTTRAVTAIGDSVMLGAAHELVASAPRVTVDAAVGRSVSAALGVMRQGAADHSLGAIVVLDIGNNGPFTDTEFDEAMRIAGPARTVIFVNLKEPRAWEAGNNAVIARGVLRYANAELADWHDASISRPDLFYSDLIHLRPQGAEVYAALVASHFR